MAPDEQDDCPICGEPLTWVKAVGWVCRFCDDGDRR